MADEQKPGDPTPGPWNQNRILRVKVSPFELEFDSRVEGSHVPPCVKPGAVPVNDRVLEGIQQLGQVILTKLDEIRRAQEGQPTH